MSLITVTATRFATADMGSELVEFGRQRRVRKEAEAGVLASNARRRKDAGTHSQQGSA